MATQLHHEHYVEARSEIIKTLDAMPTRQPLPAWTCKIAFQFGLSPAEIRVALIIADGKGAKAAAKKLGLSYHTARAHLKSIFDKTDTHRQAALAVLFARMETRQ